MWHGEGEECASPFPLGRKRGLDDNYPDDLDDAITRQLRIPAYRGAWDAFQKLAEAIREQAVPADAVRSRLEARLTSLLRQLSAEGYVAGEPRQVETELVGRLREAAALGTFIDEFLAQTQQLLVPAIFRSHLGSERLRLGPWLEGIAWKRLSPRDPSTPSESVDDVFADIIEEAEESGCWDLPKGRKWELDLAYRVSNGAKNRRDRRQRRAKVLRPVDPDHTHVPAQGQAASPRSTGKLELQREVRLWEEEVLEQLSARQRTVHKRRVEGYTSEEIARELKISPRTVERDLQRIRKLFGTSWKVEDERGQNLT